MEALSGVSWLLPAAGIVVLGLALLYGVGRWRRVGPRTEASGDRATAELYRAEDRATKREEATGAPPPTRDEVRARGL